MAYVSTEKLLKNTGGSIYKLVITAARRALELSAGSARLVDISPTAKLTSIAIREIEEKKISYKCKKK